jgi:signal transduction histidine kinase
MVLTLLAESPELTDEMMDMIAVGTRSAQTMLDLIETFLDLNVLREDHIKLDFKPLNLAQVLSGVILEFRDMAAQKEISLTVNLDEVQIMADEQHFRQSFANLISNAIKYSPVGGNVAIHTEIYEDTSIAVVHVVDDGAGIPIGEHKNVFEPFSKISTKPTAGEASTGIGLWIAREMMKMQRGEIGLRSAETGGSDFWLQIPLSQGEGVQDETTRADSV